MEYPTITLITSPDAKAETLDAVIAHEVGHNWFMSMLGTNERDHAWMDEGLNSYFELGTKRKNTGQTLFLENRSRRTLSNLVSRISRPQFI